MPLNESRITIFPEVCNGSPRSTRLIHEAQVNWNDFIRRENESVLSLRTLISRGNLLIYIYIYIGLDISISQSRFHARTPKKPRSFILRKSCYRSRNIDRANLRFTAGILRSRIDSWKLSRLNFRRGERERKREKKYRFASRAVTVIVNVNTYYLPAPHT